jgi:hypothetical protein
MTATTAATAPTAMVKRAAYEPTLCRRSWSEAGLAEVGFFDDGLSPGGLAAVLDDRRWITPTHHLARDGVVLCTTGAFSPFHAGHLRMLEIAKATLEAKGVAVAGALVQPDHDAYVSGKDGGRAACPAFERVHLAGEATRHVPWLAVDPWAAAYQDRALNYTTILERTRRLLGDRKVVYVFGSDNAGFARVFAADEHVCVGRPGYADPHPDALPMSSAKVRAEGGPPAFGAPEDGAPYLVRGDLGWATAGWDVPAGALEAFMARLLAALRAVWGIPPVVLSVAAEQEALARFARPTLSFDPLTGGSAWVSRVFHACTHQHEPIGWLSSDLSLLPAGDFALVDDDIQSGKTVDFIRGRTPQVRWTEALGLADWVYRGPRFDLVDARDFLFGTRRGGLCVSDGHQIYRAPYLCPWVDLARRVKIPPRQQPAFVRAVFDANIAFFQAVPVLVRDADNPTFWARLGYDGRTPMHKVARELATWIPNGCNV